MAVGECGQDFNRNTSPRGSAIEGIRKAGTVIKKFIDVPIIN
jgi:hypothetical protein